MRLWAALFVLRAANALAIRTVFAPDDVWQSLEVAHAWAFGYGEVTWEWVAGIRGSLHVVPFALAYGLLRGLRLDAPWAVRAAPRVVQAAIAAAADLAVVRIADAAFATEEAEDGVGAGAARGRLAARRGARASRGGGGTAAAGRRERRPGAARLAIDRCAVLAALSPAARWTLACQLLSWFDAYALTRTSSNAAEAALVAWGVALFLAAFGEASGRLESLHSPPCEPLGGPHGPERGGGAAGDGNAARARAKPSGAPARPVRGSRARRRLPLALAWRHLPWILVASLCAVVRPSSGAFWALPGALAVLEEWRGAARRSAGRGPALLAPLALALLGLGSCASFLFLGALLDRAAPFPHRWTCAPLEFLRFNVLRGGAERYGTAPWGWLLVAGAPGILGSYALVLPWGWWARWSARSENPSGRAERAAGRGASQALERSPRRRSFPAPLSDAPSSPPAAAPFVAPPSPSPATPLEATPPPSAHSPPLACNSALPLSRSPPTLLLVLALWSCVACTLSKHKEHRFLLPSLQLIMPFVGRACEEIWRRGGTEATAGPLDEPAQLCTSKPPSDGGRLDASSASTRPEIVDGSSASTRPEIVDGSSASTRPEIVDGSSASTRPEIVDGSSASTRPEIVDGSSASTRPEIVDGSSASTRPEIVDGSSASTRPEVASMAIASSPTAPAPSTASAGPLPLAGKPRLRDLNAPRLRRRRAALLFLLTLQPATSAYFCCVHQGGQLRVLRELERLRERRGIAEERVGVATTPSPARFAALFLTPCHATPWQSALHDSTSSYRFLDCSPPEYADAVERANRAARGWFRVPWKQNDQGAVAEGEPGDVERPACGSTSVPSSCNAPHPSLVENERSWFERAHPSRRDALAALLRANPSALPTAVVAFRETELDGALGEEGYALERSLRNCWIQTEDDYPCRIGLWARAGSVERGERGRPAGGSTRSEL